MKYNDLKRRVTTLVHQYRKPALDNKNKSARYVTHDKLLDLDGKILLRKKVILMTNGCSVPTCTMCPFTNENFYKTRNKIKTNDLLMQVDENVKIKSNEENPDVIAIYNDGSFFSEKELPKAVLSRIAKLVSQGKANKLTVESLPQFITEGAVREFVDNLKPAKLEVGIGLQSSNDFVREVCVNTSFSNEVFEKAVRLLQGLGVETKVYLIAKPPFLSEEEGVHDILDSIDYLRKMNVTSITLCPTRIARNTLAHELYLKGVYNPPNLWSIVDILKLTHDIPNIRVACINLKGDDFDSVVSSGCSNCRERLIRAIEEFNIHHDISRLPESCTCHKTLIDFGRKNNLNKIIERVVDQVGLLSQQIIVKQVASQRPSNSRINNLNAFR